MKIAFIGDSSGGQFYSMIAVAQRVYERTEERHLLAPKLFYISENEYNPALLFDNQITFIKSAGKSNGPSSEKVGLFAYIKNISKIIRSFFQLFSLFPDVIYSNGGGVTFSTLVAARILGIPVLVHESSAEPNPSNIWASKFATRIAVSYKAAASYFNDKKVAYTGQPIRKEIIYPLSEGAREYLHLEAGVPVILVFGGLENSEKINDTIVNSLALLLDRYQIIHQTGKDQIESVREISSVILKDNQFASRYHTFSYLDVLAIRMAAGSASLAVAQASSIMFELASWGLPAIVVPTTNSINDKQRKNAFANARFGSVEVIEEINLTPHLLTSEIDRLIENPKIRSEMQSSTQKYHVKDAAEHLADGLIDIALTHEK